MKKIIIAIMLFCATDAYAENDNASTSKEYVDAAIADKQPTVPAAGANNVMTYDSSATNGIGTKGVYDATGDYASQQNALVTAATANAAVQLAINGEFVCHEWNPNDNTDCWLWRIKDPVAPSRNLFDVSKIESLSLPGTTTRLVNNGDGTLTVTDTLANSAITTKTSLGVVAPGLIPGNTYTLSFDTTGCGKNIVIRNSSGSTRREWRSGTSVTITQDLLASDVYVYFYACYNGETPSTAIISNIQIEPGTVATPYQPYGENTYLPAGN